MERDIELAKAAGAAGVVLGVLTRGGRWTYAATRRLVDIARPMQVTFHRAFDVTRDLDAALEDVIAAGADIVLTSGGAERMSEGLMSCMRLVERAGDRDRNHGRLGRAIQNAVALCEATGVWAHPFISCAGLCRRKARQCHVLPDALPPYEVREEDVRALAAVLERCAGTPSTRSQFE